jgi:riboflavin kinase / FMN adenylyltransferase
MRGGMEAKALIIVNGTAAFSAPAGVSVTAGNFDGVHVGHRELLRRTVARARSGGLTAVALTFSPHPVRFFSPQARFYEITTLPEKAERIATLGIDALVVESFGGELGRMTPEEFAREILHRRLTARHVVVGYDFTFGRDRTGSPALLAELGRAIGFGVEIVPPVMRDGHIVSSSRIRDLLLAGRVREAEDLLCRPYRLSGRVVRGAGRGRALGYPTANIQFTQELVPLPGVYIVDVEIDGRLHRGVANVGFNPTFGENSLGLEAHVLDFDRDLYGNEVAVCFRERIRDERKFGSVEELVGQMGQDVQRAGESRIAFAKEAAGCGRDTANAAR